MFFCFMFFWFNAVFKEIIYKKISFLDLVYIFAVIMLLLCCFCADFMPRWQSCMTDIFSFNILTQYIQFINLFNLNTTYETET